MTYNGLTFHCAAVMYKCNPGHNDSIVVCVVTSVAQHTCKFTHPQPSMMLDVVRDEKDEKLSTEHDVEILFYSGF